MARNGRAGAIGDRAVDVQMNRLRRKVELDPANPVLPADGPGRRLPARDRSLMATGAQALVGAAGAPPEGRLLKRVRRGGSRASVMPKGLYAALAHHHHHAGRAAAIGDRLRVHGAALAARHAAPLGGGDGRHRGADRRLGDLPAGRGPATRCRASRQSGSFLDVEILQGRARCPRPGPRPFFSLLDEALSDEIRRQIRRPFWIDTVGRSNLIEIRILMNDGVMRIMARRSMAYASNSHIFLVWMVGTSLILLSVAILLLRNQIRPILKLATAAEDFGRGREIEFRRAGAREVRQAGHAFIEMKRRIERAVESRTTMLNGVSHDLRTILTRFRLSLALIGETARDRGPPSRHRRDGPDAGGLSRLRARRSRRERGAGRPAGAARGAEVGCRALGPPDDARDRWGFHDHGPGRRLPAPPVQPRVQRRPAWRPDRDLGQPRDALARDPRRRRRPGIPAVQREEVFKPFVRLDEARNQDEAGPGSAWPSHATSPALTAATSSWGIAAWAGCGRPSGSKPSGERL